MKNWLPLPFGPAFCSYQYNSSLSQPLALCLMCPLLHATQILEAIHLEDGGRCTYRHRQQARLRMLDSEILIIKSLHAIDTRRARAIPINEIPALAHEILDLQPISTPLSRRPSLLPAPHLRASLTMRWNLLPLYPCGRPRWFFVSPVQNWRKFSAVLGTTSRNSSNFMRPNASPATLHQPPSLQCLIDCTTGLHGSKQIPQWQSRLISFLSSSKSESACHVMFRNVMERTSEGDVHEDCAS